MSSPFSDFSARRDFLRTLGAAGVGGLVASLSAVAGTSEPTKLGEGVFELGDLAGVYCGSATRGGNAFERTDLQTALRLTYRDR